MTDRNLQCDHLPAAQPEQALQRAVGEQALGLACLMHLTQACFAKLQADWGSEMAPLLALQQACVESYAREHGVDMRDVDAGLTALLVAGGRRGPGGSLN